MRGYAGFVLFLIGCGSVVETPGAGGSSASNSATTGGNGAGGGPAELCTPLWAKSFGGPGFDYGRQHAKPERGVVALGGSFERVIDFGLGPLSAVGERDMFLVEFDSAGTVLWNTSFTSMEIASGFPLDHDAAGNLIVGGNFTGTLDLGGGPLVSGVSGLMRDLFIAKLGRGGNHLWSRRLGAPGCNRGGCGISAAQLDFTDGVLVVVWGDASLDFGGGVLASGGGTDIFVARLDANGNHVASQRYGGSGSDGAFVTRHPAFAPWVWVSGFFEGTLDFGGTPLTSAGARDGFVGKLDNDGNVLWLESLSGPGNTVIVDLHLDDVSAAVTGVFDSEMTVGSQTIASAGDSDVFVASFDDNGAVLSAWAFGGIGTQSGLGVTGASGGRVLIGGQFNEHFELAGEQVQSAGYFDAFWAAFDASGAPIGSCTYGAVGLQTFDGLERIADGTLFTAILEGTTDFGSGPLSSAGGQDIVVGKLAPIMR